MEKFRISCDVSKAFPNDSKALQKTASADSLVINFKFVEKISNYTFYVSDYFWNKFASHQHSDNETWRGWGQIGPQKFLSPGRKYFFSTMAIRKRSIC